MAVWFHVEMLPVVPELTHSQHSMTNVCRKVAQNTRGVIQSVFTHIFHIQPPETADT